MKKRLIAVSDSHNEPERLAQVLRQALADGPVDTVVFLGDGLEDFETLEPSLRERGIRTYAVAGNCDLTVSAPMEVVFTVNGFRFFACHGHKYYVKTNPDYIGYAALEKEAQAVLYGHTHVPKSELVRGIHLICPGAVCDTERGSAVYADITVEDSGLLTPRLMALRSC